VIADLRESKRLIEEDEFVAAEDKTAMMAQLEVVEVYTWFYLVTIFGDVPYSEAMDFQNPVPAYDDDAAIYADILERLDIAIGSLSSGGNGFDNADVLYDGDLDQWVKFANSLKLKMGMLLADVDNGKAKQIVEEAATNVFASNEDNARFPYLASPPNNNPLSGNLNPAFSSRQDYVVASTITANIKEATMGSRMLMETFHIRAIKLSLQILKHCCWIIQRWNSYLLRL
jgi:hypothetical protein